MRLKTQENDHEALESEFLSDPFASWVFALVKGMWMILRHKPHSQAVLECTRVVHPQNDILKANALQNGEMPLDAIELYWLFIMTMTVARLICVFFSGQDSCQTLAQQK